MPQVHSRPRSFKEQSVVDLAFSETEYGCLKKLAELFESGRDSCDGHPTEEIGLTKANRYAVLKMLEQHGFIRDPIHVDRGFFMLFRINASAVQAVRVIEEKKRLQREEEEKKSKEKKDLVDTIKNTLRKHPATAYPIAFCILLVFIATAISQIGNALKILGIIK